MSSYCLTGFISMTIILESLGDGHQSDEFASPLHKGFFFDGHKLDNHLLSYSRFQIKDLDNAFDETSLIVKVAA